MIDSIDNNDDQQYNERLSPIYLLSFLVLILFRVQARSMVVLFFYLELVYVFF